MAVSSEQMPMTTDEVAEKVFGAALGMVDTMSIYVGDRMGWYPRWPKVGPRHRPTW